MGSRSLKLVLSRKGFDTENGGCASPIFPNGRLYSLPINFAPGAQCTYGRIRCDADVEGSDMGTLVEHLSEGQVRQDAGAHFDPDLDSAALPRLPGWRPAFGQVETAQVHLKNQGVAEGDVFLFHGWFCRVARDASGRWNFQPDAPDVNLVFGWLQVKEVIDLQREPAAEVLKRHPWLRDHPHLHVPADVRLWPPAHAIYVAAERLRLPGVVSKLPGAGVFRSYDPRLVLTAPGATRSVWKLPQWFKGGEGRPWLTNFPRPEWWTDVPDGVVLRPRGRQGQEAVLDCERRPEAAPWIASLVACATPDSRKKRTLQARDFA